MSLFAHQPGLGLGSAFAKTHQPALFSDVETDGNIFLAAAVLLDAAGLQYVLPRVFGPDKASKKQQIRAACQPIMDEFGGLQFDVLETEAAIIDQQKDVDKVLEKDTNLKLRYLAEKASHGSPKDYSFYGGNGATLA